MNTEIKKQLSVLELSDLAAVIEAQEKEVSLVDLTYNASLETLDCDARDISRKKITNLATMGFVEAATNLIITGPTGAGKTYLACVLGVEACKQTLRTCYIRMPDMLGHFQTHKDNLREQV